MIISPHERELTSTTVRSVSGKSGLCRQGLIILQLENSLKYRGSGKKVEINGEKGHETLTAVCIVTLTGEFKIEFI